MPNVRQLNEKKYGISKHAFATARSYCLQYTEWKAQLRDATESIKSPQITGMPSAHGGKSNPTEALGIRRAELQSKIDKVEKTAMAAVGENKALYPYLIEYVTTEGATFCQMKQKGIPCGSTLFYQIRRYFYYMMAQKI